MRSVKSWKATLLVYQGFVNPLPPPSPPLILPCLCRGFTALFFLLLLKTGPVQSIVSPFLLLLVYIAPSLSPALLCSKLGLELCKLLGAFFCEGDSDFLFLVIVKVAGVAGTLAFGDERSLHLKQTDTHTHTLRFRFSRGWPSKWINSVFLLWPIRSQRENVGLLRSIYTSDLNLHPQSLRAAQHAPPKQWSVHNCT